TQIIPRRETVPGDVVLLQPGDIVPADLRLIAADKLVADESVLTGESASVEKRAEASKERPAEPYEASDCAFMMTRVVSGTAEGVVIATGARTVTGRIAKVSEETEHVSAFQKNIEQLASFLLKSVLIVLAVVFGVNVMLKGTDQLVPQLLFAIALAVSVV